ncbi:MAG TPA: transglutaminase-like domain-containing protein [Vicinamibacteria bacterium]
MSGFPSPSALERFVALAGADELDLAWGALLIAGTEYPDLDPAHYVRRLDHMAAELQELLPHPADSSAAAAVLAEYLFQRLGFRGNTEAYYDPRNSFLNDVLDRRTGIPITLSTVYMEVARRAGIAVTGVGLPGHFVVRLGARADTLLVDPFHAGAVLTEADCQKRLDRIFDGRVKIEARMFEAVNERQILQRMLRNLKALYAKDEDHERILRVSDLLLVLAPDSLEDLRDRGLAYAALDCYGFAVRDLEAYLLRASEAQRTKELLGTLDVLRRRAARLN